MLGEATQSEFPWEAGDDLGAIGLACMWFTSRLDDKVSFLCIIGKDLSY